MVRPTEQKLFCGHSIRFVVMEGHHHLCAVCCLLQGVGLWTATQEVYDAAGA